MKSVETETSAIGQGRQEGGRKISTRRVKIKYAMRVF
jgi:hypothetical protein